MRKGDIITRSSDKAFFLVLLLTLNVVLAATFGLTLETNKAVLKSSVKILSQGSRSVAFKWYSFFDVPIKPDVWQARWDAYGNDRLLSSAYPVVYLRESYPGWNYYYTSVRFKVTARELPEILINSPKFLPYNLMGNLEPTVANGIAQIKDWYLDYVDSARRVEIGFPADLWDGYVSELRGTVIMDRNGTKKILGITEAQYQSLTADPTGWWAANEHNMETAWSTWLYIEDARLDTSPFFGYPFTDWPGQYTNYLEISYNSALDQVTLTLDLATYGMECLLARWFQETFIPGYEWWWDDFKFNATIGPSLTNIDMDTAVQWAMHMWSYNDTKFAGPVWVWRAVRGDVPDLAELYNVTSSPAYPYIGKTYYVVAPGNEWYDKYGFYDYTPSAWDLKQGETLTFDWSNVHQKGPIWVFNQKPWVAPQRPNDTITQVFGMLELAPKTSEPYADWGASSDQINYSPVARTMTFNGPINMTDLSFDNIRSEWGRLADSKHPDGLLPWGEPFLEFKVVQHDIAVTSVTPSLTEALIGQTVDINVEVVNLGTTAETFNVTAFYDLNPIGTKTVTSLGPGEGATFTFNWNTTGVGKGSYTTKATAGPVLDEIYTVDNALVGGTVRIAEPHDVTVTNVSASPTTTNIGDNVTITVVVKNTGILSEIFSVTVYGNLTMLATQTDVTLTPNQEKTLTFRWNTTGVDEGSYTIKATASSVLGETDTTDNTYIDGTVSLKQPAQPSGNRFVLPPELVVAAVAVIVVIIASTFYIFRRRRTQSGPIATTTSA